MEYTLNKALTSFSSNMNLARSDVFSGLRKMTGKDPDCKIFATFLLYELGIYPLDAKKLLF